MLSRYKHIISIGLLLLWSSVQFADVYHHMHEDVEEVCEISEEHLCTPHHEHDVCDLCVLVHTSSVTTQSIDTKVNSNGCILVTGFVQNQASGSICLSKKGRGPPIVV